MKRRPFLARSAVPCDIGGISRTVITRVVAETSDDEPANDATFAEAGGLAPFLAKRSRQAPGPEVDRTVVTAVRTETTDDQVR